MKIFEHRSEMAQYLSSHRANGAVIGFVPTMGALHNGHLSLIMNAKADCDIVVCSIYVNPTQFNNPADLEKYPRTPEEDLAKLAKVNCDVVFMPSTEDIYPREEDQSELTYDFGHLEKVMEGEHRPGHFRGVAMVVSKLFSIVQPHRAYFGKKDYQQLVIIKELVKQKDFDIKVIGCPIIREPNGLAMSSRNMRLSESQREEASFIFSELTKAKKLITEGQSIEVVKEEVIRDFKKNPPFDLEYFEIADEQSLLPVSEHNKKGLRGFIAVNYGGVRLIDNLSFNQ